MMVRVGLVVLMLFLTCGVTVAESPSGMFLSPMNQL